MARAAIRLPSSCPRCTPSAPTKAAKARSSLISRVAEKCRVRSRRVLARRSCSGLVLVLSRYCTIRQPPVSAPSTSASRRDPSAQSGVTAYRPRSLFLAIAGFFLVFVVVATRPEKTIRDELAHAGTEAVFQCLPGVVLGIAHSIVDAGTAGDAARDS